MAFTSAPRLALLAVDDRPRRADPRPAVRRYRLGRVISDLGPVLAGRTTAPQAAPRKGVRAP